MISNCNRQIERFSTQQLSFSDQYQKASTLLSHCKDTAELIDECLEAHVEDTRKRIISYIDSTPNVRSVSKQIQLMEREVKRNYDNYKVLQQKIESKRCERKELLSANINQITNPKEKNLLLRLEENSSWIMQAEKEINSLEKERQENLRLIWAVSQELTHVQQQIEQQTFNLVENRELFKPAVYNQRNEYERLNEKISACEKRINDVNEKRILLEKKIRLLEEETGDVEELHSKVHETETSLSNEYSKAKKTNEIHQENLKLLQDDMHQSVKMTKTINEKRCELQRRKCKVLESLDSCAQRIQMIQDQRKSDGKLGYERMNALDKEFDALKYHIDLDNEELTKLQNENCELSNMEIIENERIEQLKIKISNVKQQINQTKLGDWNETAGALITITEKVEKIEHGAAVQLKEWKGQITELANDQLKSQYELNEMLAKRKELNITMEMPEANAVEVDIERLEQSAKSAAIKKDRLMQVGSQLGIRISQLSEECLVVAKESEKISTAFMPQVRAEQTRIQSKCERLDAEIRKMSRELESLLTKYGMSFQNARVALQQLYNELNKARINAISDFAHSKGYNRNIPDNLQLALGREAFMIILSEASSGIYRNQDELCKRAGLLASLLVKRKGSYLDMDSTAIAELFKAHMLKSFNIDNVTRATLELVEKKLIY